MAKEKIIPIDEIIQKYQAGYSVKYLAQFYNCAICTIYKKLKKNKNFNLRPIGHGSKKYNINERYFDIIETEKQAYWLGIFLTDGSTSNKIIRLSFQKADEGHLRKFLKDINSNHPISHQKKDQFIQSCVTIGNKYLRNSLIYKGVITNNKTHFNISEELERHYWRGIIDGNGCLKPNTNEIGIVGSKSICDAFQKFCQKYIKTRSIVHKEGNIYRYYLHGIVAFDIAKILYKNSQVYLDRKYNLYLEWCKIYQDKPLFPRVVRFIKSLFNEKIYIKRCKMSKLEGECIYHNGIYTIKIDKSLTDNEAISCLIHEAAHIQSMLKQEKPHGVEFGKAYSKIYKLYEKEFT